MKNNHTPVWSWFVRLSHGLVAGLVCIEWLNETGYWHRVLGYLCFTLVCARCIEACMSNTPSSRLYWPTFAQIKQHLIELKHGVIGMHAGHNPLGQLAVYCMWGLIILLAISGWLSQTDAFWGEDTPVLVHAYLAYTLLGMVVLHVLAVLIISKLSQTNLVSAMWLGK